MVSHPIQISVANKYKQGTFLNFMGLRDRTGLPCIRGRSAAKPINALRCALPSMSKAGLFMTTYPKHSRPRRFLGWSVLTCAAAAGLFALPALQSEAGKPGDPPPSLPVTDDDHPSLHLQNFSVQVI